MEHEPLGAVTRGRRAAGAARPRLAVWRSPLRADFAAVLGLGSHRITRCVRCALYAQTNAASQTTMRAARADPSPPLLAAPHRASTGQRLPRGQRMAVRGSSLPQGSLACRQSGASLLTNTSKTLSSLVIRLRIELKAPVTLLDEIGKLEAKDVFGEAHIWNAGTALLPKVLLAHNNDFSTSHPCDGDDKRIRT